MGWSNSAIFQQAVVNPLGLGIKANTGFPVGYGATGLLGDIVMAALYGNTGTPDRTAAVANTGYNTGQWVTANEASGTGYTPGGAALSSLATGVDSLSSSVYLAAASQSWTSATLTAVFGALIYDSSISGGTVADQGMCYNYFGGSQGVTAGTFTIQWPSLPNGSSQSAIFNFAV